MANMAVERYRDPNTWSDNPIPRYVRREFAGTQYVSGQHDNYFVTRPDRAYKSVRGVVEPYLGDFITTRSPGELAMKMETALEGLIKITFQKRQLNHAAFVKNSSNTSNTIDASLIDSIFGSIGAKGFLGWDFAVPFSLDDSVQFASPTWASECERIVRELGMLSAGWAGLESEPPSNQAISDLEAVANLLPPETQRPIVEVDDGNGFVTLRWRPSASRSTFALMFNGKREVIGTLSPRSNYTPWKASIEDEDAILSKLDIELVNEVITGK